jgi:hypothetical protein
MYVLLRDNYLCERIASRKNLTLREEHASWIILLCPKTLESVDSWKKGHGLMEDLTRLTTSKDASNASKDKISLYM